MSDSFADLWNTSAPLPTKQKPQTLSAAAAASSRSFGGIQRTTSNKPDAFSFLAASSSHKNAAPDISHEAWAGLDLLDGGLNHLRPNGSGSKEVKIRVDDDDDWGLTEFGSVRPSASTINPNTTSFSSASNTATKPPSSSKTLWDLGDFTSSTGSPISSSPSYLKPQSRPTSRSTSSLAYHDSSQKVDSPDIDFDFGSREDQDRDIPTGARASRSSAAAADLLLLDDDDDDHNHLIGGAGNRAYGLPRGKGLMDDVDDVVQGSLAGHDEDEEDILGVLSKPVEVVIAKKNSDFGSSRSSTTISRPTPRLGPSMSTPAPPSPAPHILGQIVEMGFSVSQAKKALAATADGKDVQAALESLLNGGGNGGGNVHESSPIPPPHHPNVRGPPKGQKERERERKERELQRSRREDTSTSFTGSGPTTAADIQDQADKLLLQASEIGLSVLSRASAFWKEGKEKVVKVMEERGGGTGGGYEERGRGKNVEGRPRGGGDGRPKWMKEVVNHEDDDEFGEEHGEGFKDAVSPIAQERGEGSDGTVAEPTGGSEVDLFSSDPVATRPQRPSSSQRPSPSQRPSQPSTRTHSHQNQTRRPPPRSRALPTTLPTTLSLASNHKNSGTSQFKLGQYGPASESYTSAIALLPPGHLLLIPLYTNRSLARLRCGEYIGAGEDAGEALKIICIFDSNISANSNGNLIWNPDTELPELIEAGRERANEGGWLDSQGVGVDLGDGYVKALKRRAEAWEGREKWVEAGRDWGVLAGGGGWIGEAVKKEAVRGAGRCRKAIGVSTQEGIGSSSSSSTSNLPLPKPKPKLKQPPLRPPSSNTPSKALLSHQATTLQAEADDTLKHQLKDSVDTRISAWKNGKETNIRALLASLDMVLWDEILLGIKVNGLGDLVTNGQVKKGYVKAIARIHPDKLNTSNSTVEQRMLANSVFAALNEAWIAFQGGK